MVRMEPTMTYEDKKRLFMEVKNRRAIWDRKVKEYNDKHERQRQWNEIANMFGTTDFMVKSVWRNAKELFRRELYWKNRPGGKAPKKQWLFYNDLLFTKEFVNYGRRGMKNYPSRGKASQPAKITDQSTESSKAVPVSATVSQPCFLILTQNVQASQLQQCPKGHTFTGDMCDKNECIAVDKEKLIAAIESRPMLWQRSHPMFYDRVVSERLWIELAEQFNSNEYVLKQQWKGLKDIFRRQLKKSEEKGGIWRYFQQMSFIRDQMSPIRRSSPNEEQVEDSLDNSGEEYSNTEEIESIDFKHDFDFEHIKMEAVDDPLLTEPEMTSTEKMDQLQELNEKILQENNNLSYINEQVQKEKQTYEELNKQVLELEQKKLDLQNTQSSGEVPNSDLQFFQSLMPYLDSFSPLEKLELRMKIQQVVLEKYSQKNQTK